MKRRSVEDYKGRHCDAYHDGKISPSRHVRVEILNIVPLREMSEIYYDMWRDAVTKSLESNRNCDVTYYYGEYESPYLFDLNCNKFIFARIINDKETAAEPMMFAMTDASCENWYGVNWNYRLDIDNKLRKSWIGQWRKCAKENGKKMVYNPKKEFWDYRKIDDKETK